MLSKSFIFQLALVGFILTSSECFGIEKKIFPTPTQSAIADTSTTIIALNGGAVEMNPMGLYVSTILKIGIIMIVNERLEGDEKYLLEKTESTIWTGAAVNNLFVILQVTPVTAVAAGIVTALIVWNLN